MSKLFSPKDQSNIRTWSIPVLAGSKPLAPSGPIIGDATVVPMQPTQETDASGDKGQMYQKGYQDGINSMMQQLQEEKQQLEAQLIAEWQSKFAMADNLLQQLSAPMHHLGDDVEQQLVKLVKKVVKRLAHHEISLNTETIHRIVKDALGLIEDQKNDLTIKTSSADHASLSEKFTRENCQVLSDDALSQGDVQIYSKASHINLDLDTRINNLIDREY
jgi:flagellar biosynthesis/type III secretory pathway protein FliH